MRESHRLESARRQNPWVTVGLLVALVLLFVVPLYFANPGDAEGERFGGTDAKATEIIEATGHEPWFEPIFSPGSSEVESGIFALQAGLGASVLGYTLGRLHERSRRSGTPGDRA